MNLGFWSFYNAYNQNRMFTASVDQQGHDWCYTSRLLGQTLESMGHQVATLDMKPLEWFDRVFFGDYPDYYIRRNRYFHALLRAGHPDMNLILGEPAVVRPDNYNTKLHEPFRKVITYKKDLVAKDPSKYVLYHYPVPPPPHVEPGTQRPPFARRKLCCLIQSYMVANHPGELFSERVRAVRWFEANAPQDFDLIGVDWDRPLLPGRLSFLNFALRAAYRRVRLLDVFKFRQFPSCIGPNIRNKHLTLMDYRFSLGYENAVEKDWVSEKLWDCFNAGCVPVYLGAPNVTDYVPANTFIDKRNFTYEELYRYMSAMSEREYNGYLEAAADFLRSPAFRLFTSEAYVELLAKNFG
ncbi:MAG: glycosyltransferase family 10 domain-containing protein [Limisphaerales bacterium]